MTAVLLCAAAAAVLILLTLAAVHAVGAARGLAALLIRKARHCRRSATTR